MCGTRISFLFVSYMAMSLLPSVSTTTSLSLILWKFHLTPLVSYSRSQHRVPQLIPLCARQHPEQMFSFLGFVAMTYPILPSNIGCSPLMTVCIAFLLLFAFNAEYCIKTHSRNQGGCSLISKKILYCLVEPRLNLLNGRIVLEIFGKFFYRVKACFFYFLFYGV